MFNFDANNYLNNVAQTPHDHYHDLIQATVDSQWQDTTLLSKIKEEKYPFNEEYEEYEAWVDTISDVSVSTLKTIGNYISVVFKSIDHKRNYRGQKYIWRERDRDFDSVYLCYDMISNGVSVAETKLIKCNNSIKIIDKENGSIHEEPIFVGWELSSTNNQQNKDGIIENRRLVCLMQKNKYTKDIIENQRFMTSKTKAFKVTQIDDTNEENYNKDMCTMYNLFIEWTPILKDRDNLDLEIADYYDYSYNLTINQEKEIEQVKGFIGSLNCTIKLNDEVVDRDVVWISSNQDSVKIDNNGNYEIIGNNQESSKIKCYLNGNEEIFDEILIKVVEETSPNRMLKVSPIIKELKQNMEQEFICDVYENGEKLEEITLCNASWNDENEKFYKLEQTEKGWKLKNIHSNKEILKLTFSDVDGLLTTDMDIKLGGLF